MKKIVFLMAAAIFSVVAMASCSVSLNGASSKIKPSKEIATAEYQQAAFDALDVSVVASVRFVQANESKVVVSAPENYIKLFKFENNSGQLTISFVRNNLNIEGKNVHITVYSPRLRKIDNSGVSSITAEKLDTKSLKVENSGVGDVTLSGLTAKTVDVECSGVGSVTLKGTAASVELECSGVGSIDAEGLSAQTVDAEVSGVGGIRCHATESIKGEVSGVGSLKYKGTPKAKDLHRSGIGKISQL